MPAKLKVRGHGVGLAVAHRAADPTQGVHTATECLGPAQAQRLWNLSPGERAGLASWDRMQEREEAAPSWSRSHPLPQASKGGRHPRDTRGCLLLLPPVPPPPPMLPGSPPTLPLRFWRASGAHPWCRVPGSHHSCRPFPRGCCRPGLGSDLTQPPLPTPGRWDFMLQVPLPQTPFYRGGKLLNSGTLATTTAMCEGRGVGGGLEATANTDPPAQALRCFSALPLTGTGAEGGEHLDMCGLDMCGRSLGAGRVGAPAGRGRCLAHPGPLGSEGKWAAFCSRPVWFPR